MDPAIDKYADWTPYNFAFNDPANKNDPGGDDPNEKGPPPFNYASYIAQLQQQQAVAGMQSAQNFAALNYYQFLLDNQVIQQQMQYQEGQDHQTQVKNQAFWNNVTSMFSAGLFSSGTHSGDELRFSVSHYIPGQYSFAWFRDANGNYDIDANGISASGVASTVEITASRTDHSANQGGDKIDKAGVLDWSKYD